MATRRSTRNLNHEPSEQEANELLSAICLKLDNINDSLQLIIKNQQNDQNAKKTNTESLLHPYKTSKTTFPYP